MTLALAAACACSAASAAIVNYSAVIDLDPSMIDGAGRLVVPLPGGPFSLNVGDTLQGAITFANNGRITVFNGTLPVDREWITGSFRPDDGTSAQSVGTFSFLGRQGDYLLPDTVASSNFVGAIGFGRTANYTNSSFSFAGISFSATYVDDLEPQDVPFTTHVTPGLWGFPFEVATISESVPEPSTWAVLVLGFAALGQALRRRRGLLALAA
jgi:hypothetical protein